MRFAKQQSAAFAAVRLAKFFKIIKAWTWDVYFVFRPEKAELNVRLLG